MSVVMELPLELEYVKYPALMLLSGGLDQCVANPWPATAFISTYSAQVRAAVSTPCCLPCLNLLHPLGHRLGAIFLLWPPLLF